MRIGRAEGEGNTVPILARPLGNIRVVDQRDVWGRLPICSGCMKIIRRLPADAANHCM